MQQSLSHIRDAKRLLQLVSSELGVPREAIEVIVNRYNHKHSITAQDIQQALKHEQISTVPNDFTRVSDSVNSGRPLLESARNAPITRTLQGMAQRLSGSEAVHHGGVLKRAVSYLFN
jgi:pilus assembly protein CpaE